LAVPHFGQVTESFAGGVGVDASCILASCSLGSPGKVATGGVDGDMPESIAEGFAGGLLIGAVVDEGIVPTACKG